MGGTVPSLDDVGQRMQPPFLGRLRSEIAHLLDRGGNTNFPGAQPVSFARKHLRELRQRDYYVCEKSDGIRCLLYCTSIPVHDDYGMPTVDHNGRPMMEEVHYLIDRKNDYYGVRGLHFPKAAEPPSKKIDFASYHTATLLDGELLWDEYPDGRRILKFLVFDCLFLDNQNLLGRTLDKRLAYFMDKLYAPYAALRKQFPEDCERFAFLVEKKSFQFGYGTQMMFKDILPNLPHGSDGLIFTCVGTPYKFGTDEHILKWKPAEENTIDFRLGLEFPPMPVGTDDVEMDDEDGVWEYDYDAMPKFTLLVHHGDGDDRSHGAMFATPEEWQRMKDWAVEKNDGLDGQIVECHKDEQDRWRFNRFRVDKQDANHYTTVGKVLESIEDSVSQEELIDAAGDIKAHWKARQAIKKEETRKRAKWEEEQRQKHEAKKKQELAAQELKREEAQEMNRKEAMKNED